MSSNTPYLIFLLLLIFGGHLSLSMSLPSTPSIQIPDGVHHDFWETSNIRLMRAESECEETYGFLPCSTTVLGNLFLIVVYCYITFFAANYVSKGSDLLLEILGPGVVGGMFLPAVRVFPDAMLILVSGLSGSTEIAQSKVSVGMGLLAGSTILLLTTIWGTCIVFGRRDFEGSIPRYSNDTKRFSWTGSGVITDKLTKYAAKIMAISIIPFIIVQLSQVLLNSSLERRLAILVVLIVSVVQLVSYCLYQVLHPGIQRRHLNYAKHRHVIAGFLQHLNMHAIGKLLDENGEPNIPIIEKLFQRIDENGDGYLSASELRALVIGIRFEDIDFDKDDAVEKLMTEFDTSQDLRVDMGEFVAGVSKWLNEAKRLEDIASAVDRPVFRSLKLFSIFRMQTKHEHDLLGAGDHQSDGVGKGVEKHKREAWKAVLMLLLGTAIVSMFADPLIDTVGNFSEATGIPTFFISFIALPFATNPDAVFTIKVATEKKTTSASLSCSEVCRR
ncbi:hypothetical protein TIFTF001_023556 [Ficus carica]|uniref:EF-hand domain-containing protein n=1 Tax=Ficus carica TaxID=3494 RepID=A0AA88DGB4_FICCA|nr:hypothetical protein TIFTF001_023556 [Ficus carica]